MRRFAWIGLVAALLVPATVVAATPAQRAAASAVCFGDAHGLHVLAVKRYDARDYNVRILSKANIGRPLDVRILLPAHYAQHPQRHYPVLYLFHGTSGVASDWVKSGHAERTTAPYPVITVIPECGFKGAVVFWFPTWVDRTTSPDPLS